ncbi:hypothetical protein C6499_01340 [Candidatus Poribacteria bacterium]|nr:MAG: hypothetical protein C6499_01340 [Candidatus Poribacteria bacterium]
MLKKQKPLRGLGFLAIRCYRHTEETPKQINPYGTEEVFEVFKVSASYPVRLGNRTYRAWDRGVNLGIFHVISKQVSTDAAPLGLRSLGDAHFYTNAVATRLKRFLKHSRFSRSIRFG